MATCMVALRSAPGGDRADWLRDVRRRRRRRHLRRRPRSASRGSTTSRLNAPSSTACANYEEGQYERAEVLLKRSLAMACTIATMSPSPRSISPSSRAPTVAQLTASKHSVPHSSRTHPSGLTEAEVGHPIWGPVYKQVAAEQIPKPPPAAK